MSAAFDTARRLIEAQLAQRIAPVLVALEGGAASGKSTLAAALSRHFDNAPIIPMDDFFLPPSLRTAERFAQPGGNIHYERFEQEVAQPLRQGRFPCYQVFDCKAGKITHSRACPPAPVILVEGVYSLHPLYADVYTLRLFLKTTPQTQDARLRQRGDWLYRRFMESWLSLERMYFAARDIPALCSAVLETDD